jgi:hypothetical protein
VARISTDKSSCISWFSVDFAALNQLPEDADNLDQLTIEEVEEPANGEPSRGPMQDLLDEFDDGDEELSALPNLALDQTEEARLQADPDGVRNPSIADQELHHLFETS